MSNKRKNKSITSSPTCDVPSSLMKTYSMIGLNTTRESSDKLIKKPSASSPLPQKCRKVSAMSTTLPFAKTTALEDQRIDAGNGEVLDLTPKLAAVQANLNLLYSKLEALSSDVEIIKKKLSERNASEKRIIAACIAQNKAMKSNIIGGFGPQLIFKPIENIDEMVKFLADLKSPEFFEEKVQQLKRELGFQQSGIHAISALVNLVLGRDFQRMCSWTGTSRTDGVSTKFRVKDWTQLQTLCLTICNTNDRTLIADQYASVFKNKLENATKGAEWQDMRKATHHMFTKRGSNADVCTADSREVFQDYDHGDVVSDVAEGEVDYEEYEALDEICTFSAT